MDIQDEIIAKLTEIDINVKEIKVELSATKADVEDLKNHVEGFVRLHEALDCEVAALRNKVDRFEERLSRVEMALKTV
jgi:predicted  nucleic acid-binding Zn-ribbon protein